MPTREMAIAFVAAALLASTLDVSAQESVVVEPTAVVSWQEMGDLPRFSRYLASGIHTSMNDTPRFAQAKYGMSVMSTIPDVGSGSDRGPSSR